MANVTWVTSFLIWDGEICRKIKTMQLAELLKSPGARVIDVRTPGEYAGGHVAGSTNIPLNEVPNRVAELRNSSGPIVLCCASGNRSGQACLILETAGFTNLINVSGGMLAWQERIQP